MPSIDVLDEMVVRLRLRLLVVLRWLTLRALFLLSHRRALFNHAFSAVRVNEA